MVGKNIKFYRKKANLTQKELGDILNMGKSNISMYESSDRLPPVDVLVKLSKALNVDVATLLGINDSKEENNENEKELVRLYRHVSETHKELIFLTLQAFNKVPEEKQKFLLELIRTAIKNQ